MRNHSMRTTNAPSRGDDAARRRLLGLAALVLTLAGGYALAHRGAMPAALVQFAADADAAEDSDEPEVEARSQPTTAEIMAHIDEVAARHRVSPKLVAAIVAVESEFNPRAVSRRGAQGLMQLMPATAKGLGVHNSFDPAQAIDGAARLLRDLKAEFGRVDLALAAYNAGPGAVHRYGGIPPYPETQNYVRSVLAIFEKQGVLT